MLQTTMHFVPETRLISMFHQGSVSGTTNQKRSVEIHPLAPTDTTVSAVVGTTQFPIVRLSPLQETASLNPSPGHSMITGLMHSIPTPVKVAKLKNMLDKYKDRSFIINGFKYGFRIGYQGDHKPVLATNSKSVNTNPKAAAAKINEEITLGRIAGPFSYLPFKYFKSCPLALRMKSTGKWRLLHNLSFPYNADSVNFCIDDNFKKVNYATINDAVNLVKIMPGCYMAKTDIKDAFRIIPVHPKDPSSTRLLFEQSVLF